MTKRVTKKPNNRAFWTVQEDAAGWWKAVRLSPTRVPVGCFLVTREGAGLYPDRATALSDALALARLEGLDYFSVRI